MNILHDSYLLRPMVNIQLLDGTTPGQQACQSLSVGSNFMLLVFMTKPFDNTVRCFSYYYLQLFLLLSNVYKKQTNFFPPSL